MTTYHDRDEWTSTDASGVTLTGAELVGPAFHWPGTKQSIIGVESQSQVASRLRGYRNFHVTGRGWRDIGYTFGFDQAGRIWMLRSTTWGGNLVGAHCASPSNPRANHKYVGCLLILGADEKPSAAMLEAINHWYHTRFLSRWFGRTDARGHGQVPGASTTCQGPHVRAALAAGTIPGGPTEGDMPLTDTEIDKIAKATWRVLLTRPDDNPNDLYSGTYLRFAWNDGKKILAGQAVARERDVAILAAVEGLDTAAILARINEVAAAEAAAHEVLADTLDSLTALLSAHADGTLDAETVVQRWREVLGAALVG